MKINNKKGQIGTFVIIAVIAVLAILAVATIYGIVQQSAIDKRAEERLTGITPAVGKISIATVEFNAIELASGAQDAAADLDIDIFEWDASKNNELANQKHYLDCSGVVPAYFDGEDIFTRVTDANICKVNTYKFWQSFTAGDSELKIDDVLRVTKADLDDVGGSGTLNTVIKTNKVYLVTLTEGADADEDDVIPMAFLINLSDRTSLDREDIAAGTIKIRFEVEYFSDAVTHSKTRLSGECEDDADAGSNTVQLTSALNGFIDSSLTTAETISADCTIKVEVTSKGYKVKLLNPLANSNSEMAYLQVDPYGENSTGSWVEYGTNGLTGDIGFSASTNNSIIWEGLTVGSAVITDTSTSDAVKLGTEKLYQGNYAFFSDIVKDSPMVIPIHISEIKVDYDLATAGGDQIVSAASGSSPEAIVDFNLVGLEATTDIIGQTLNG